jgi:hypothetical protein
MTKWLPASTQRKVNIEAGGGIIQDPTTTADLTTGYPSLVEAITGQWAQPVFNEAFYDSQAIPLGSLYYAWKINANVSSGDANWSWIASLSADDVVTSVDSTANLRAAGPGNGTISATTSSRMFARVRISYAVGGLGGSQQDYTIYWTCLAVYGNHGLTLVGPSDYQNAQGVAAQDVVRYVVNKYAPKLAMTQAGISTVSSSSQFVIPQLVWLTPTTAAQMVKDASRFDLQDWAVWEGPTLFWNDFNTRGGLWRARVGPSKLQEAGPQVDRIWNSVVVQFTDVVGIQRTVGPIGSGSTVEDATLTDPDPTNPATAAGLSRRANLQAGTGTAGMAIKVGQVFLAQQKQLNTSGQAQLVGYVSDSSGVMWPTWAVRAGDQISFVDASDTRYRRIVKKSYDHNTRTATIDLDSPPQGLDALLQRLGVVIGTIA